MHWIREHRTAAAIIGLVGGLALIAVLVWFQPQTLFVNTVVDDTLPPQTQDTTPPPTTTTTAGTATTETSTPDPSTTTTTTTPIVYPQTLSSGEFIDLAHAGTGSALILELEDGSRILRFENLDVDNGPDLRVILSTSALVDDDSAYDDGDFVDLGDLKGNKGNQNYEIPNDVDLDRYATVAIWCRRFNVTFNAAPISP
jgi:hypothetical protein